MAGTSRRTFRALRGFSYGPNGRHAYEPGDLVHQLPTQYLHLVDDGVLEEVGPDAEAQPEVPLTEEST